MKNYETLARVAKVIDDYTVVLNRGSDQGIQLEQTFIVFGLGDEIIDPVSGENLGTLEEVRGRVKVTHVQERVCTAESVKYFENVPPKTTIRKNAWLGAIGEQAVITEDKEEKVDELFCKIGDYAKQIR